MGSSMGKGCREGLNTVEDVIEICGTYLKKLKIELNNEPFNKCLRHYHNLFLEQEKRSKVVLDAKPGHGKTTALYCFVNYIINYTDESLLLVFKEKTQQRELKTVLEKLNGDNFTNEMFYMWNSQNIYIEKEDDFEAQILCVTHSRFEKFLIFKQYGIKIIEEDYESKILRYNDMTRTIIVDEEPNLFMYSEFSVNDELWIEEAMNTTKFGYTEKKKQYVYDEVIDSHMINTKEKLSKVKMYFRCMIPYMIAKEHLENTTSKTKLLKHHINSRDIELFELFFSEIIKKLKKGKFITLILLRNFYYSKNCMIEMNKVFLHLNKKTIREKLSCPRKSIST